MSRIVLGKTGGRNVTLDLDVLLRTRLLVQSGSGGGKSWLLRRLAEQLFGKVQVIIIDPEGEFASLREKFGFVLVGKGGETPADVRSAEIVAHKLLELRASAVCDLYEMRPAERHSWVRIFLETLIDAPKKLWHPLVLIEDEAHVFCPEKGAGDSIASEAMIAFSTRGRKRGFCGVPATQRLSKLRKDLAAECDNVLIGKTTLAMDRERAADEIGVEKKRGTRDEFSNELRRLKPGQFFGTGPAISDDRILIAVGAVETTHPEAGSYKQAATPPPPPSKIKALLPKLADLPKEAEEKAKTISELKQENRSLKLQLRSQPAAPLKRVVGRATDQAAAEKSVQSAIRQINHHWQGQITKLTRYIGHLLPIVDSIAQQAGKARALKAPEIEFASRPKLPPGVTMREAARLARLRELSAAWNHDEIAPPGESARPAPRPLPSVETSVEQDGLTSGRKAILRALAEFEALGRSEVSRKWVAALAGVSHRSSSYTNNLGALRSGDYITYGGSSTLRLTEKGLEVTPPVVPPDSTEEMLERCLGVLSRRQGDILKALHAVHPLSLSRDELAERVGVSAKSSAFTNNLGAIRSAGMLKYGPNSIVGCEGWLFID